MRDSVLHECMSAYIKVYQGDALDTRPHEFWQTLQRPDDIVDLADALLGILLAGAQVESRPAVRVVAPDHHLPCDSLPNHASS